jgi:hypothetical protein
MLHIKGPKLLCVIFSLYSIVINLNLALLSVLFAGLDYIIKRYFFDDVLDIKSMLLLYMFVFFLLYMFGNSILYFFWNIIITPLFLLL